ncbi:uncharacterized protein LOC141631709 [Silene latifolia]|uniref:uncharacterized protein LOC141631709 n=1 Tax=Silene latifolia TaxID=37657 RepID=UPI003D783717
MDVGSLSKIEKEAEFDDVSMGFSSSGESDNEFEHAYDATTDDLNNKQDNSYKRLFEAANEELYEGCQSFSKLSFLLHLYHIKCMFHWSIESFNKLLELLLQAFPQVKEFPSSFYEGKKIINDLGLGYEKIHACPSNCMLFWGENSDKEECNVCHTSRWKKVIGEKGKNLAKKGEGAKVMSPGIDIDVYLQPLISELKLLWSGVDAFDAFEGEKFKLRAALHSTINDFPAYAMLSDGVFFGYDACPRCTHSTNSGRFGGKICYVGHRNWLAPDHHYRSEANLFDGTIAFGYAPESISGSHVLTQQEKIEYMYGKTTKRLKRPNRAREVGVSTNMVNDSNCEDNNHNLWNKKSIFFELPYWEHNPLRHNLDVMHIEKNVCDNILGTLLDMDKSRDDVNARKGLKKLGIKEHLWLQDRPNREPYMPQA